VPNRLKIDYRFAAGPYLTKFFSELRDRGKLWAVKCPECGRLIVPPSIVHAPCHVKLPEYPEGWVELSGKGHLDTWTKINIPQMDLLGRTEPDEYLHCVGWMDEGITMHNLLAVRPDSEEESKLQRGLRIELEIKPAEQRVGKMTDIRYFKVLWDEPLKQD
jgi:hypothetical protein